MTLGNETGHLSSRDQIQNNLKLERLKELRQKVKECDKLECRTDDMFLSRFLIAQNYHLSSAFAKLKGYTLHNEKYSDSWLRIDRPLVEKNLKSGIVDLLPGCDKDGNRIFWLRVNKWNPRECAPELALQLGALVTQMALADKSTKMTGLIGIFDMKDLSFSQIRHISASFAKEMISFLMCCLPMNIKTIHIVREPTLFGLIFAIFKSFLNDKMRKQVILHGSDFASLHKDVDKKLLPAELNGEAEFADPARWLEIIQRPDIIKEMEEAGYIFNNNE